ncbi:hypothetical protein BD413DRAFT_558810 [Trametes elegans]|nr:hypothetical protein BD413DRAFT_558810 [Trametes elegans]
MATYYIPRRTRSASRTSSRDTDGQEAVEPIPAGAISADHSIYIFPSPASTPPSPGASVSSAPTDFSFSSTSDSRSTPGTRRLRGVSAVRSDSISSTSYPAFDTSSHVEGLPTPVEDVLEIDLDLWDTASDQTAELSESGESWALEGEVERVALADVGYPYIPRPGRPPRVPLPLPQFEGAIGGRARCSVRPRQRSRTRSRHRTLSISSLAPSSTSQVAPHPRISIPLLSFFSSLLSIDLDDPALRLLTHAETDDADSVLFPGHSPARLLAQGADADTAHHARAGLFESDSDTDTDSSDADEQLTHDADGEAAHGTSKLLLARISDQSAVALRSLREGLAVGIPGAPDIALALPLPRPADILGLWRVFGEVCARGSQAWKEVWGDGAGERQQ